MFLLITTTYSLHDVIETLTVWSGIQNMFFEVDVSLYLWNLQEAFWDDLARGDK